MIRMIKLEQFHCSSLISVFIITSCIMPIALSTNTCYQCAYGGTNTGTKDDCTGTCETVGVENFKKI